MRIFGFACVKAGGCLDISAHTACLPFIFNMLVLLFVHDTPENRTTCPMGNSSGGRPANLR